VPNASQYFWPGTYNPNESQKALQGRVDDDMGGASPMGSGAQNLVNQAPPVSDPTDVNLGGGAPPPDQSTSEKGIPTVNILPGVVPLNVPLNLASTLAKNWLFEESE